MMKKADSAAEGTANNEQDNETGAEATSAPVSLENLLAAYEPEKELEFTLPRGGIKCRARLPVDASERVKLHNKSAKYNKIIKDGIAPESWRPYLPVEDAIVAACVCVSDLMIEPKVSFPRALQFAKENGSLIDDLSVPIMRAMNGAVEAGEEAAVEDVEDF